MAVDKAKQIITELRELQQEHMWKCTLALSETFEAHGHWQIHWDKLCAAAYHSGAAREIQQVLFKHE